jgi:hypothetical protein
MTTYEATGTSNKTLLRTCGYLNRWLTKLNAGLMILDPYGKAKSPASSFPHHGDVHVRYMNFCDVVQVACALASFAGGLTRVQFDASMLACAARLIKRDGAELVSRVFAKKLISGERWHLGLLGQRTGGGGFPTETDLLCS